MAITLVATAGAKTANTYVDLADAETILEGKFGITKWDAATDANKNRALATATQQIDRQRLAGVKYYSYAETHDSYQALHFPIKGNVYNSSLFIPKAVERACAFQAEYLIRRGAAAEATSAMIDAGVKSYSGGRTSEVLDALQASELCTAARSELGGLIKRTITLQRG